MSSSAPKVDQPKKKRPNPKCATCSHALSFHPRDLVKHRRPCRAFGGCSCKNFVKPDEN